MNSRALTQRRASLKPPPKVPAVTEEMQKKKNSLKPVEESAVEKELKTRRASLKPTPQVVKQMVVAGDIAVDPIHQQRILSQSAAALEAAETAKGKLQLALAKELRDKAEGVRHFFTKSNSWTRSLLGYEVERLCVCPQQLDGVGALLQLEIRCCVRGGKGSGETIPLGTFLRSRQICWTVPGAHSNSLQYLCNPAGSSTSATDITGTLQYNGETITVRALGLPLSLLPVEKPCQMQDFPLS